MMSTRLVVMCTVVFAGLAALAGAQSASLDYPQWRGPGRDGGAAAFAEPKSWPDRLTLKWKVEVGPGYATPIVVRGRVYTHTRRDDREVMQALDAATGRVIWQTGYPAPHTMVQATVAHGPGPKSTPLFHNGKLFTLGNTGIVSAFDAATGKLVWQKPGPAVPPLYGTAALSPVADGGLVIVHVGGHNQGALAALSAETGDVKWSWAGDGPAYGSPIVADVGGTRQVIAYTQENVVGVSAMTGDLLWKRPLSTRFANNALTPILYGETIIVSGYEMGVTAFRVVKRNDHWVTEVVWENRDVSLWMSNGVLVGDALFGLSTRNKGQFFCLDAKTGKTQWSTEGRQAENAAIVKAGDLLFLLKDDAELIVARRDLKVFKPLRRYKVAESATWAQPAISGNRVFVKDVSTLALWLID